MPLYYSVSRLLDGIKHGIGDLAVCTRNAVSIQYHAGIDRQTDRQTDKDRWIGR